MHGHAGHGEGGGRRGTRPVVATGIFDDLAQPRGRDLKNGKGQNSLEQRDSLQNQPLEDLGRGPLGREIGCMNRGNGKIAPDRKKSTPQRRGGKRERAPGRVEPPPLCSAPAPARRGRVAAGWRRASARARSPGVASDRRPRLSGAPLASPLSELCHLPPLGPQVSTSLLPGARPWGGGEPRLELSPRFQESTFTAAARTRLEFGDFMQPADCNHCNCNHKRVHEFSKLLLISQ